MLVNLSRFRFYAVTFVFTIAGMSGAELSECASAVNRGEYKTGLSCAQGYIQVHGLSASALVLLAQAHMGLNDTDAAFSSLTKALHIDAANVEALYFTSKLSSVLARNELQMLYRIDPDSPRIHQLAAESYHMMGAAAEEEREYKAALEGLPQSTGILIALGDLKREQARYDEAIAYYSRALELAPRNHDALYGRGTARLYANNGKLAILDFRMATRVQPDSAVAHFALGDALLRSGENEEAASELSHAVRLEPGMKEAYALLGRVFTRLSKQREAANAFARFQSLSKAELDAERIAAAKNR